MYSKVLYYIKYDSIAAISYFRFFAGKWVLEKCATATLHIDNTVNFKRDPDYDKYDYHSEEDN